MDSWHVDLWYLLSPTLLLGIPYKIWRCFCWQDTTQWHSDRWKAKLHIRDGCRAGLHRGLLLRTGTHCSCGACLRYGKPGGVSWFWQAFCGWMNLSVWELERGCPSLSESWPQEWLWLKHNGPWVWESEERGGWGVDLFSCPGKGTDQPLVKI